MDTTFFSILAHTAFELAHTVEDMNKKRYAGRYKREVVRAVIDDICKIIDEINTNMDEEAAQEE